MGAVRKYKTMGHMAPKSKFTDWLFSIFRILLRRLTIKAGCQMDLSDFPMDKQRCPLQIGSCEYQYHTMR